MRESHHRQHAIAGLAGAAERGQPSAARLQTPVLGSIQRAALGWLLIIGLSGALLTAGAASADAGEATFRGMCASCHTTTSDRLVGPGLAGVTAAQDRDWLIRKITEPDRLHGAGDARTRELVSTYGMPMPNLGVNRAQAEAILDWLAGAAGEAGSASAPAAPAAPTTPAEVTRGRELFQGTARLAGGGVACNACHSINDPQVFSGGTLALGLSDAHQRLGDAAIASILRSPPFPAMRVAYEGGRSLTDEEIRALGAFMASASAQPSRAYGTQLIGFGIAGTFLLLALFSLTWRGRRRESVYQRIYDRQVKAR